MITLIRDRISSWLGPPIPRVQPHDHDWCSWRQRTLHWDWHLQGPNWEEGQNRPYIDVTVAEKRWCLQSDCIATETRNERQVRQYLEIAEEEFVDNE